MAIRSFDNDIIHIHRAGLNLLHDMKIKDYNWWRLINSTIRPDISGQDFSGKDLSGVYLNGASCIKTDLSDCNLRKANLVQADLLW
jgi:uncharacterized protein YjbI with pentapeptide repeats